MAKAKAAAPRVLVVRKRRDGSTTIENGLPDPHTFSARWIARHLGSLVDVTITVHASEGDIDYRLTGFGRLLDGDGKPALEPTVGGEPVPKLNFTALEARRV